MRAQYREAGLVLFGLYLGQRLGDLARLTWRAVNLETDEYRSLRAKRGAELCCRWCSRSVITCLRCRE